jgi:site-specific DNA recombinase
MGKKIRRRIMIAQSANQRVVREYVQRGHIQQTDNNVPITQQKLRVAAYARVSTDEAEQLNSYNVQCEYYTTYIQGKPEWEFVGLYADEGITGTSAKRRKEFQRLIKDALDNKIDLILVKSVSRFARNTVDSLQTVRSLRDKGVRVFFEKENIDSMDAKCDMILSIYSSLAEEESRSISTNIRWAHQKKVERGEVVLNFNNIYGYQQDEEKNVTIKIQEAEVVREIYHKYLIGYSLGSIIRELKEAGIKSPMGGKKWSSSTVKRILENEKYIGDVILQKTYKRDFLTQRRVLNTGQAPQKYVENNHPAIIDKLTWEAVQAEMERRNSLRSAGLGKGRYDMRYAFSGVIECGECGAGFRRHNYTNDKKVEPTWVCKQHIKGAQYCSQEVIKEKMLEELFVETLNQILDNRDSILRKVEKSAKEAMQEVGVDNKPQIETIDLKIEQLQAEMLELNKQRGNGTLDADQYSTESRNVMEQLDELFRQRDELTAEQSEGALFNAQYKMLKDFLKDEQKQTEFDKDIFMELVAKVVVKSRDDITFVFSDGTEVNTKTKI